MILAHYYAVAVAAMLLTAAWLFKAPDRTAETALAAFIAWGLVGLLGDDTETYVDAGATLQEAGDGSYHAVATGEQLVAAPVPAEIRLFAAMWALLSGLALLLYVAGTYPPEDNSPADTTGVDTT